MAKKINIGLFGFGCVGQGLYHVLNNSKGFKANIVKIAVKNKEKERPLESGIFTFNKQEILDNPEIDLIVELIDDADEAFKIVSYALSKGKHVVTANKKMVATHLKELYELQHEHNVSLLYEASSCGSIPIIRTLEEYFDNEQVEKLSGIFNGTTNYILTKTISEKLSYEEALKQAQEKGFAESDPTNDVEGFDAKFKAIILALHAFGVIAKPEDVLNNIRPRRSRAVAQNVADLAGGVAYGGNVEGSTDVAFGGPTADFIEYGLVNGTFAQGPAHPEEFLDQQNNPMPYWRLESVSGGAIQLQQVVDATAPSGYVLRATINPGATNDEAYVQQVVPIGGSRWRWLSGIVRATATRVTATDNGFSISIAAQYLKADQTTTTGAAWSALASTYTSDAQTRSPTALVSFSAPADAYYLRVRIRFLRAAAADTASGTFDVSDIRFTRGVDYLMLGDSDGTGTYAPAYMVQNGGALTIVSGGGVGSSGVANALNYLGVQKVSVSSGAISSTSSADVTITWGTAWADTNYTVLVSVENPDATGRQPPSWVIRTDGTEKSAGAVVVRVFNPTGVSQTYALRVIGIHD